MNEARFVERLAHMAPVANAVSVKTSTWVVATRFDPPNMQWHVHLDRLGQIVSLLHPFVPSRISVGMVAR